MPTDKPTTALGMLTLLIAKCDSAAELARTAVDAGIFKELATEARRIEVEVVAGLIGASQETLDALRRIRDAGRAHR